MKYVSDKTTFDWKILNKLLDASVKQLNVKIVRYNSVSSKTFVVLNVDSNINRDD